MLQLTIDYYMIGCFCFTGTYFSDVSVIFMFETT